MIREVDLAAYLPEFMQVYNEPVAALNAESPEFDIVWNATNRVLYNRFIATADEYGISRFEKMLGIYPSTNDTLESRRSRVQSRWFNSNPYTWKVIIERLISLCGKTNFTVTADFEHYRVDLEVNLELFGQVEELEYVVERMTPCNMVFNFTNKIPCAAEGDALAAGGVCLVDSFLITNDKQENIVINSMALHGGTIQNIINVEVTDEINI